MTTDREVVYRKIPMLDLMYEISADGRHIRNIKSKHELMQRKDQYGYYYVNVGPSHHRKVRKIHQLVADAWIGPNPGGLDIDHIDRNKQNNHYGNLRYVTRSVNCLNKDFKNYRTANQLRLGNQVTVDDKVFPSFTEAAEYLHSLDGGSVSTYRSYFKRRRSYIKGHKISYCRDCML